MLIRTLTTTLLAVAPFAATAQGGIWDSIKSAFVSSEKPKPPMIKVLIAHDIDAAMLEVKGKYNIIDPYKNTRLGTRFVGKAHLIQALAGGLKWGEEFPGTYQIEIIPDDNTVTTVIDGIEYHGNIYIYDIGGTISIVNEVDIEDYLSSILALQYEKPVAEEAMAAAAIAARTDAYYKATNAPNPYWHVDAKKVNYLGNGVAHRKNGVDEALAATRYMVINRVGAYDNFSIAEADKAAKKGDSAAKILAKSYPNTTIELIHKNPNATSIGNIAERDEVKSGSSTKRSVR